MRSQYSSNTGICLYLVGDDSHICLLGLCLFITYMPRPAAKATETQKTCSENTTTPKQQPIQNTKIFPVQDPS